MLRRLIDNHPCCHMQMSCSLSCRRARSPSSSLFLNKGRRRRRPRHECVREIGIWSSSFFMENPGLTLPNANCQFFRLYNSSRALSTSFSELHTRISTSTSNNEKSGHNIIMRTSQTTTTTTMLLDDISQQLTFLFSDLNLRNNKHARSILLDDQYLPMKNVLEIKSMRSITTDDTAGDPAAMVMDAIDHIINKNDSHNIQLHTEQLFDNGGELFVKRVPPFNYNESIKNHHHKMMIVEGWPAEKKSRPRWAISHVRMLICNDTAATGSSIFKNGAQSDSINTPLAYWRYDHKLGVINIEFKSDSEALDAWNNLDRAASSQSSASSLGIEVHRLPAEDTARKAYKLQIGEIALTVRSIDLTTENDVMKGSQESNLTHDQSENTSCQDLTIAETSVDVQPPMYSKVWETYGSLSLSQFTDAMNQLYQYHISLPPLVSGDASDDDVQLQLHSRRHDLYGDVLRLVSSAKASMNQGGIRALRGKDGYALSNSLGMAMRIYSETPIFEAPIEFSGGLARGTNTPYDACLDILDILRKLNVDIHPSHYTYALRAACNESRWREASRLFLTQVDGDDECNPNATGGYVPIDPELAWEGLYAVACDSKTSSSTGVDAPCLSKRVFDTAMKMSMISPSSQEKYILAAGVALGRAGLWRDCLIFSSESESASTYGPVIAAAAMLACIECERYTEAISAYDLFMSGNQNAASEWQWGGGNITAVKPLCRDLALHAMGRVDSGGLSDDAMRIFVDSINEGSPVSSNAVLGLSRCLEFDGDWQSSIKLLKGFVEFVYRKKQSSWHVIPETVGRVTGATTKESLSPSEENILLTDILASVVRVCNQQGQHGLGILLCFITNKTYIGRVKNNETIACTNSDVVKTIVSLAIVSENDQILEAFVQSLCGLGCGNVADSLLSTIRNDKLYPPPHRSSRNELTHAESWMHAIISIDRVLKAMDAVRLNGPHLSSEDRLLFERGLRRAMEHCNDSNQSAAALELFYYAGTIFEDSNRTWTQRVRLYFGMEKSYGDSITNGGASFHEGKEIDLKNMRLSDALLAAIIKSHNNLGESEKARAAYLDGTLHLDTQMCMPESANNTLEALLDIDLDECMKFLDSIDGNHVNPSTFYLIARRFAKNGLWPEIGEIYNRARNAGCISEELGSIAMQAVVESELLDGKISVLRRIIDDLCGLVGMKSSDWIKSRYWGIKKRVGFHYARLLMRWDDPSTSQKEEYLFAVNEIRRCSSEGTVAKHEALMCIVKIARLYDTEGRVDEGSMSNVRKRNAINLILEACEEATRSGLINNHLFTAEATRSLRDLKANKECVMLVRSLISSKGAKSRHRVAMEEAMLAASDEHDHDSLELIKAVFDRSGYDPR